MEGVSRQEAVARHRPGRRAYLMIAVFAFLLVLFPFLFWYGTWFGRKLSDGDVAEYLNDAPKPRRQQHAVVQIGERLSRRQHVSRWYPKVIELAASPSVELRQTVAWLMGQDRKYAPFQEPLRKLLADAEPMVRRNAALALAARGDPRGRPELLAMLRPSLIAAPAVGAVKYRVKAGEFVNPGTMVARIGTAEVRASVPGEVRALEKQEGTTVTPGETLATILPDKNHAWEALRALFLVGETGDLEDVERFARADQENLRQQSALTAQAIRARR